MTQRKSPFQQYKDAVLTVLFDSSNQKATWPADYYQLVVDQCTSLHLRLQTSNLIKTCDKWVNGQLHIQAPDFDLRLTLRLTCETRDSFIEAVANIFKSATFNRNVIYNHETPHELLHREFKGDEARLLSFIFHEEAVEYTNYMGSAYFYRFAEGSPA